MTTSGTFNFTVNASDIVREMMLNVGAIGEAEVPTAQEYTDCLRKLNMLVKQWMGKQDFAPGLKMWTRQRGRLFLGAAQFKYRLGPTGDAWAGGVTGGSDGQTHNQTTTTAGAITGATSLIVSSITNINNGDYIGVVYGSPAGNTDIFWTTVNGAPTGSTVTLTNALTGPVGANAYVWNYTVKQQRPLGIVTSVLRDIYNNDVQQNPVTLEDYEALPTKTMVANTADPTAYYYESQIGTATNLTATPTSGNGSYYIDCGGAQDVTKSLHMVFLRPVMDLNNPGDNPEYPQQWYRALCWGGSREICGMFDAVWTEDMQQNYLESVAMAREPDSETTTFYFQPNAGSPYDP
ncbi:MAG TPA: hypothetical protein VN879_15840 [Candidatus Acidoferrales bacterium]|nr:hypothetical protein [Candidatus Acidoferrales bacterium]